MGRKLNQIRPEEKESRFRRSQEARGGEHRLKIPEARAAHCERAMRQQHLRLRRGNGEKRHTTHDNNNPAQWEVTMAQMGPEGTYQWCATGHEQ